MTDVDSTLAAALERLAPRVPASPDWAEVLTRAGSRRRGVRWVALALAAALVALAAAPAFGLHGLFRADKRPRVHFAAELQAVAGSGSGSFTAEPLRSFWHVQHETTRLAGFSRPLAVIRPDCQPPSFRSSRTRNQSSMSIRGFARASPYARSMYAACRVHVTPKTERSGGFV